MKYNLKLGLNDEFRNDLNTALNELDQKQGNGVLVFDTLAELQSALPNGSESPVWVKSENSFYYWGGSTPGDTTAPIVSASPNGGTFTGSQNITLSANESATIYYTTNGTTPTTASVVYSSPIPISATTTLKFFAKDAAGNSSAVKTVTFTLQAGADTTAPVLTITPNGSTFATSQSITMSMSETGDIHYTLDGSTPTTASPKYTSALTVSATTTLKAFARDTAGNQSAVQTAVFTKQAAETTPPVITASPNGGTFASTQQVTLSANETATIYYTTDGTTPTTSSPVYSAPILLSATTTLKFFGKDTAGNSSAVQSVTYTKNSLPVTVEDSFNRDDSAALGTMDSGHTWTNEVGNDYAIASNQAYSSVGTTWKKAYIQGYTAPTNYQIEYVMGTPASGIQLHPFKQVAISDFGGGQTWMSSGLTGATVLVQTARLAGDKIRVTVMQSGAVEVFHTPVATGVETKIITGTHATQDRSMIGFSMNAGGARIDSFKVTQI